MDRPISLLLVEDERVLRGLVSQFLRVSGFTVQEAVDGQDGLDRCQDSGPFQLILTDLMMPRLCGVEFCRRVRQARPHQPIIVCSAAIMPEQEQLLRRLGIAWFLAKPYQPDRLITLIHECLASSDAAAAGNGRDWAGVSAWPAHSGGRLACTL